MVKAEFVPHFQEAERPGLHIHRPGRAEKAHHACRQVIRNLSPQEGLSLEEGHEAQPRLMGQISAVKWHLACCIKQKGLLFATNGVTPSEGTSLAQHRPQDLNSALCLRNEFTYNQWEDCF